jgi:hypothetical protein
MTSTVVIIVQVIIHLFVSFLEGFKLMSAVAFIFQNAMERLNIGV